MNRRAHVGFVALLLFLVGRALLAAAPEPIGTVHLRAGWATFGQATPQGLAYDGLQIGNLPTQTDVKNRWPDSSIKFAILTANAPSDGDYPITASAAATGTFTPAPRDISVELSINGTPHIAVAPEAPGDSWLNGPLVREARHVVAPSMGGEQHPFLRVNFDIRYYSDGDARMDVSVENVLDRSDATTVTYDVAILADGVPLYAKAAVEHYYLTRWRQTFAFGEFSMVTPDIALFNRARALPPYLDIVGDEVDAADGPSFEILREGALTRYMQAHSGRPEIAPYPDWAARYLVHKNPDQKRFVLANGDLSGSWPIHVREPEADELSSHAGIGQENLVSINLRPLLWLDDRAADLAGDGIDFVRGKPMPSRSDIPGPGQSPLSPDNAHQPSIAYVPYLLTGDRYYAEEMAFWANYALLKTSPESQQRNFDEFGSGADGILGNNNETRGTAWALRNLVDAAAYYPDASPVRNYLRDKVTNNLQWLDNYVNNLPATNPLKIPWIGFRSEPGMVAMWEMNYVAWAIDRANKQGFAGGLAHRDVIAKLQLDLFRNTPAYPRTSTLTSELNFHNINGQTYDAGTEIPWGAPFTLQVADFVGNDPTTWWMPQNHVVFQTLEQIGNATQADGFNHRPYAGFYGPEARLNLMIGIEKEWAGAQVAYDFLYPFIGTDAVYCASNPSQDRPDLQCRAGWALGFYPEDPVNPPDDDADDDGFTDQEETAAGSDPNNSASTPEVCDGLDNDLDGTKDDGLPNNDGDDFADACDPDDDNDGRNDDVDPFDFIPNRAPTIESPGAQTSTVGVTITPLPIVAVDLDGDSLTYVATQLPPGLTFTASDQAISGTPTNPGSFDVTVTVSDGLAEASTTFRWFVQPPPAELELVNPGPQTNTESDKVRLNLQWNAGTTGKKHFNRPRFSADNLPPGLRINRRDGLIFGHVARSGEGVYQVTVTMRGQGEEVSQTFQWTILPKSRAPRNVSVIKAANKDGTPKK